MHEAVAKPGGLRYWNRMNAGSCWGAPGILKQDECRKLLRGTGEEVLILKQNERKKLWGDKGGSLDIETKLKSEWMHAEVSGGEV